MKYIIEDKQLFNAIYKFIDDDLAEDNISWDYEEDYDTEEYNEHVVNFVGDKYTNEDMDDKYFTYISKEYYEILTKTEPEFASSWIDIAPLLDLNVGGWWCYKLNNFFGNLWTPVFEQWFVDTYPQFPVKTFIYPELR